MSRIPVTIEEFVLGADFLNDQIKIWTLLMDDLKAMNPDILIGAPPVHEAFLGGTSYRNHLGHALW